MPALVSGIDLGTGDHGVVFKGTERDSLSLAAAHQGKIPDFHALLATVDLTLNKFCYSVY